MPPLVLPAHDPNTMHTVNANHVMCGQKAASVLNNPVVEINEDTWNNAYLNESAVEMPLRVASIYVMNKVATDITVR